MPIHTTACRPKALPRSEPFVAGELVLARWSRWISRMWRSVSSAGAMVSKTLRASSSLPLKTRKRGDSGRREGDHAVDHGGHGAGEEHPAPGLDAEPERLVRAARGVGKDGVGEQGGEDTGGDGQLLQRREPAADVPRRDLGDVGRRDHRREADAQAAHQAPEDQVPDAEREAGPDGADQEEDGAELHGGDAAVAVGHLARQDTRRRRSQAGRPPPRSR